MKISAKDVEHVADLARMYITDEEKKALESELSAIIDFSISKSGISKDLFQQSNQEGKSGTSMVSRPMRPARNSSTSKLAVRS